MKDLNLQLRHLRDEAFGAWMQATSSLLGVGLLRASQRIGITPSCCSIPRSSLTARYSTILPLAKRHRWISILQTCRLLSLVGSVRRSRYSSIRNGSLHVHV